MIDTLIDRAGGRLGPFCLYDLTSFSVRDFEANISDIF